jgi:hypothetical protein
VPRYHGRTGLLYMSTSDAGSLSLIISLSEWTLDKSRPGADTTSFDDNTQTEVLGLPRTAGTFTGFYNSDEEKIFQGSEDETGVVIALYPSRNVMADYHKGPAYIDYSMSGGVGDAIKLSANFRARGNWVRST